MASAGERACLDLIETLLERGDRVGFAAIGRAGPGDDRLTEQLRDLGVQIAASTHRGWLTMTIDDDGGGIAEEMREEVFKPFFRLDEARNQDESGTGLGLAIARDIARSHGGDITLHGSPLGGLRVVIRVPS